MIKKKCPDCDNVLTAEQTICACGYDFSEDDCPSCERRIPEGTAVCPYCSFKILGKIMPKSENSVAKVSSEKNHPSGGRKIEVPLSIVYVPAAYSLSQWPEWRFMRPVDDKSMLAWAGELRRVALLRREKLTNHALWYLADTHENRELRSKSGRLLELLGGDDYK